MPAQKTKPYPETWFCLGLSRGNARCLICFCGLLMVGTVFADALDTEVNQDPFLQSLTVALSASAIDVVYNLNSRDVIRQRIQRHRLGRFPDLPLNTLPNSHELNSWEAEYQAQQIGGIAILRGEDLAGETRRLFLLRWLDSGPEHRLFVSFYRQDEVAAETINSAAGAAGYSTAYFFGGDDLTTAGNLYATAAQRLAIDSRSARRYRSDVTEFDYLGKRVRRNSNSLFRENGNRGASSLARREPAVFLKETLGDEFTESTIREIVVPGGVALGETASLTINPSSMIFADGAIHLRDGDGVDWQLPALQIETQKALFDFVMRSESIRSDSIVDIDAQGRVRISYALRDTDAGYTLLQADAQPFAYVPNLPVLKSVVVDIAVSWFPVRQGNTLQFETSYEVRFLSADNMRLAQTRVALEYEYASLTDTSTYQDSWGRDTRRLHDNLDYAGLGSSMVKLANYAGWIGLFRKLQEDQVSFLVGRYQFMKIDKRGRDTPSRY